MATDRKTSGDATRRKARKEKIAIDLVADTVPKKRKREKRKEKGSPLSKGSNDRDTTRMPMKTSEPKPDEVPRKKKRLESQAKRGGTQGGEGYYMTEEKKTRR